MRSMTQPCVSCRLKAQNLLTMEGGLALRNLHTATDGTRKLLFTLQVQLRSLWHAYYHMPVQACLLERRAWPCTQRMQERQRQL